MPHTTPDHLICDAASSLRTTSSASSDHQASMESIRDSLAEELVKMTGECEKLRSEVSQLPGMKAEMEALRLRHAAALDSMNVSV
ncbi:golgin candidate 5-like [Helianthus annuus]|uniref:golgin candidate 5-like n=1 Tax=Helianthus annuus TaxID=4232 RepID=UPI0016532951|nr:golgin candidate 5-like [Helianthus annuus]